MTTKIRVLLCDDSPLMRRLLAKMLSVEPTVEVVGEAENGEMCLAKIEELAPDVTLLDLAMPVMDGVACLKKARELQLDTAFLVVSTKAVKSAPITLEALEAGAVDFITKAAGMLQMETIQADVLAKVMAAAGNRSRRRAEQAAAAAAAAEAANPGAAQAPAAAEAAPVAQRPAAAQMRALTVMGGSAGCMQVLPGILAALPQKLSGCLVLMLKLPPFLTKQIPSQFGKTCTAPIELAVSGAPLQAGRIYVAPGGEADLTFERDPTGKRVVFKLEVPADKSAEGAPSIDAAMRSAVKLFRDSTRGILISGTGKDGLEGLRSILTAGGETVVQDRASAVAPQLVLQAVEMGLAQRSLSAQDIAALMGPRQ